MTVNLIALDNKVTFFLITKTYVVGTQKNHFNVTVLLSTINLCSKTMFFWTYEPI